MAAPVGNRFWEARSTHGRAPVFEDAETLWDACVQYFNWVAENPLMAAETVKFQGRGEVMEVPKMRAMTITGLCMFIGVTHTTWREWWNSRKDFSEVMTQAEAVIYEQKFTGAAADLLNPNIIARDLGLADKRVVDNTVNGVVSFDAGSLSDATMEELLAARKKSQSNGD